VFVTLPPQPFQLVPADRAGVCVWHRAALANVDAGAAELEPAARNIATARRSAAVMREPCIRIEPSVNAARMESEVRDANAARLGARESAAGLTWQLAQSR
jgi:hypothetical protein